MKRLDRSVATIPACLASCDYTIHQWDNCPPLRKSEIRGSLEQMQCKRCAYCEGDLEHLGQHIEHFRRKRDFPAQTFDWDNLFGSCDQSDSCGHYKDTKGYPYDPINLVNPCLDDPDDFFRFRSDGAINVRSELSQANKMKAEETLRVFNLNPEYGRLRNMRKGAVAGYIKDATEAVDAGMTALEIQEYFRGELAAAIHLPFSTAIRHVLTEIA